MLKTTNDVEREWRANDYRANTSYSCLYRDVTVYEPGMAMPVRMPFIAAHVGFQSTPGARDSCRILRDAFITGTVLP